MGNRSAENLTVGEIAFGNSNILQDVIKRLLKTLVDKNIISDNEVNKIITESLSNQIENIKEFGERIEQGDYVDKFKDSREVLLSQAGALKEDDNFDEFLAEIYKQRGHSEDL